MTAIQDDCPHCASKGAAFRLVAEARNPRGPGVWDVMGCCGVCQRHVLFVAIVLNSITGPLTGSSIASIVECYPKQAKSRIPESIPENVKRPLIEAEESFATGHFTAAGSCYRKSIERALRHIDPDTKGMLNQRIRKLEGDRFLPLTLIELLDHVRLFGNEVMHEDDIDPTFEDCSTARDFVDLFLNYTFTLPAMIASAKQSANK